jgi:hypothetical protein
LKNLIELRIILNNIYYTERGEGDLSLAGGLLFLGIVKQGEEEIDARYVQLGL